LRDSGSNSLVYEYAPGGKTPSGREIPSIPVMWLRIRSSKLSAISPAIIDTGFDGGVYSDDRLPAIFEGEAPERLETLHQFGGRIKCEVFKARGWLLREGGGEGKIDLGDISVYIPIKAENLAENIVVGREILNALEILLKDGSKAFVTCAKRP